MPLLSSLGDKSETPSKKTKPKTTKTPKDKTKQLMTIPKVQAKEIEETGWL